MAISLIAVGLMWTWMYNPNWGIINSILRGIGLEGLASQWLGDPDLALFSVIAASYWNFIPLIVIILGAGLTQIPTELMDAARIDGSTYLQQVRLIKIPLLRPSFTIVIVITVIFSLRVFDIVFATEILEHLNKEQMYFLLDNVLKKLNHEGSIIITIPLGNENAILEQKELFGNIHEEHKTYLTIDDFKKYTIKHKVNDGIFMIGNLDNA